VVCLSIRKQIELGWRQQIHLLWIQSLHAFVPSVDFPMQRAQWQQGLALSFEASLLVSQVLISLPWGCKGKSRVGLAQSFGREPWIANFAICAGSPNRLEKNQITL
jgi:hypothetical protein